MQCACAHVERGAALVATLAAVLDAARCRDADLPAGYRGEAQVDRGEIVGSTRSPSVSRRGTACAIRAACAVGMGMGMQLTPHIMSAYAQQPGTERLAAASSSVLLRLRSIEPKVGRASPEVRYV